MGILFKMKGQKTDVGGTITDSENAGKTWRG